MRAVAAATGQGLRRALATPKLALILWLLKATLAALAVAPSWLTLRSAIARLPEADPLRSGLPVGVLADLAELHPDLLSGFLHSALVAAVVAVPVSLAAAGGALHVLAGPSDASFGERFGLGALRFFGPFLRLGLLAAPVAALAGGLLAAPFLLLLRSAGQSALEEARLAAVAAGGLGVLLVMLAVDAARVRLVRDGARHAWPALVGGLRSVGRRPLRWLGVWAVCSSLAALAFLVQCGLELGLPKSSPAWLLLGLAMAQAAALAQSALRVALLQAEIVILEPPAPPQERESPLRPSPSSLEAEAKRDR